MAIILQYKYTSNDYFVNLNLLPCYMLFISQLKKGDDELSSYKPVFRWQISNDYIYLNNILVTIPKFSNSEIIL